MSVKIKQLRKRIKMYTDISYNDCGSCIDRIYYLAKLSSGSKSYACWSDDILEAAEKLIKNTEKLRAFNKALDELNEVEEDI